ncbi:MAG: hypothetical protein MUF29_03895 [Chitinophagaceae bacterium]|jgi:hypothetical protein|nr:hypothetical protein [Chitinophagaceae bacterium]
MQSWLNIQPGWVIALLLILLMTVALWLGRTAAMLHARHTGNVPDNSKTIISSLLALTAFLLGFAFSMSATRYENRRQAIVEEANAIGTAILRADLYPDSMRTVLRTQFKTYLDQRISFFTVGAQYDSALYWENEAGKTAAQLWATATTYARSTKELIPTAQMIPALNAAFDAATTRHYAITAKVPSSIMYMLFLLAIVSAFFSGYNGPQEKINKFVSAVFCIMTVMVIYLILDLDRPRRGTIRFDETHQAIESLQTLLKP